MSEKSQSLRATLDELHEQLESVESRDPEVRALLGQAIEDLRSALDTSSGDEAGRSEDEGFTERFEEAAAYFEEEHPVLAGTVRRLIETLSQMGI